MVLLCLGRFGDDPLHSQGIAVDDLKPALLVHLYHEVLARFLGIFFVFELDYDGGLPVLPDCVPPLEVLGLFDLFHDVDE